MIQAGQAAEDGTIHGGGAMAGIGPPMSQAPAAASREAPGEAGGPRRLLAREHERDALVARLEQARSRLGSSVVVHGPAGIGKTALLDQVAELAIGFRVLRTSTPELESAIPFAALNQLCTVLAPAEAHLPPPQLDAINVALGLAEGPPSGPLLVGLATLSLLCRAAEERPVLCIVDDAHWLDLASAQVLSFVARRVAREKIVFIFAAREERVLRHLAGLDRMALDALPGPAAGQLLQQLLRVPLHGGVKARILSEAQGNPLALVEYAAAASASVTGGGFAIPQRNVETIEQLYLRQVGELPRDTRVLLLAAAADPLGDPALLMKAAALMGIDWQCLEPAQEAGMIEIDQHVRFRHPLLRSTVYRTAAGSDRRRVHGILAAATDAAKAPDWHAWHRAEATLLPDEAVAAALIDSAERARARGGTAAAAAFVERAAMLTSDPALRARRVLRAAQAYLQAGDPNHALVTLNAIDAASLEPAQLARSELLRGLLAMHTRRDVRAHEILERAAGNLASGDASYAAGIYLNVLQAAWAIGSLEPVRRAAAAALAVPRAPGPIPTRRLLLDGTAHVLLGDRQSGFVLLREALSRVDDDDWTQQASFASFAGYELWDMAAYEAVARGIVERARASGVSSVLSVVLGQLAGAHIPAGRFRTADVLLSESDELADGVGVPRMVYARLRLEAARGDRQAAKRLIEETVARAVAERNEFLVAYAQFSSALLHNGMGQYEKALADAEQSWSRVTFHWAGLNLREMVEAAVRSGKRQTAWDAFESLRARTQRAGTPMALATECACMGMIAEDDSAERHFRDALGHLSGSPWLFETARTQLLLGEWLRRERRRAEAREQLDAAFQSFTAMGANGFAARASRELRALGARANRAGHGKSAADLLTPQELQIARLAASGKTSKEIAAELFVSPRTVDAHLGNTFTKLGIASRRQLRDLALDDPGHGAS